MYIRAVKYNIPATIGLFGCSVAIVLDKEEDEIRLPDFVKAEEYMAEDMFSRGYYPNRYTALQEHLVRKGWQIISAAPWPKQERPKGEIVY